MGLVSCLGLVCLLLYTGCTRPMLPALTLAGRAGFDLAQRRHSSWSARLELDFALQRAPEAASARFEPGPRLRPMLTAPCADDVLCRYARRATERAQAAHTEMP